MRPQREGAGGPMFHSPVRGSHVRTAQREHGNARQRQAKTRKRVGKRRREKKRTRASIPSLQLMMSSELQLAAAQNKPIVDFMMIEFPTFPTRRQLRPRGR